MKVAMPQLGESVTEGTLGKWLKQPGDAVEKYEAIVEVATDKVNAEVPSPASGIMGSLLAQEGETLPVGAPICEIETASEAGAVQVTESAQAPAEPQPEKAQAVAAPAAVEPKRETAPDRPRSSPYVRRLAREAGVDLANVPGNGPSGRVLRADLQSYLQNAAKTAVQAPVPSHAPAEPAAELAAGDKRVPLTPMRRAIAAHMVRSKQTSPHATTWVEVDVQGLVDLRERVKHDFRRDEGVPLTYVPFVIEATVAGLRQFPQLNAQWDGDAIIVRHAIHIGVAVSVDDGLVVPVLKHADGLSVRGIARAADDLIRRARAGSLTMEDLEGGTFTVNNPGRFGSMLSTPIISQPQAAILSMEAIVRRVVPVGDAIAIRSMMNLSLSFDHRVLDGAIANRFLGFVKERLEAYRGDQAL